MKDVGAHVSVSLDGGADLLRAGGDGELGLALQALVQCLLGQGGGPAHVLVAGVGAAANQPCKETPHKPLDISTEGNINTLYIQLQI